MFSQLTNCLFDCSFTSMKRIIISCNGNKINEELKDSTRGARVFGLPVIPAVESYINDISPRAEKERILSMFFCGSPSFDMIPSDFNEVDLS